MGTEASVRRVNRRSLITGIAAGSSLFLAACSSVLGSPRQTPATPVAALTPTASAGEANPAPSPTSPVVVPTQPRATATAPLGPGVTEVVFLSWIFDDPGRRDAMRNQFAGFLSSQSKYGIREHYAQFSDYSTRVLAQLAADGIAADVMMTAPELTPRLLKAGAFAPLDDIANDLKITDLIRPGVKSFTSVGDSIYGFDSVSVGVGLLYNTKIYSAAGIKAPPSTVDEWVTIAQQLTDRSKEKYGYFATYRQAEAAGAWFAFQEFALPYDGKWADAKKPLLTSDPIINGVKLFKRLYDTSFPQGVDGVNGWRMFTEEKVAHFLRESTALNLLKSDYPDLFPNVAGAVVPWPTRKSIARVHPMHLIKNSKNPDGARAWLEYLYTPKNYVQLTIDSLDFIPMYPITTTTPGVTSNLVDRWTAYLATVPASKGYLEMAETFVSPTDLLGDFLDNSNEFGGIVIKHLEDVLERNVSPEKAMAEAQKEAEALVPRA